MCYIYYSHKRYFESHCSTSSPKLPIYWTKMLISQSCFPYRVFNTWTRKVRKSWASNNWGALLKIHKICSLHKPCSLLCPVVSAFHVQFKEGKNKVRVSMPWATHHKQDQLPSFILYWESDKNIERRGKKMRKANKLFISFQPHGITLPIFKTCHSGGQFPPLKPP